MNDKTQEQINQEIHEALMELSHKTNEMWEILSAFKLFGRAVMWVALFLGGVGTAWAAFGSWIKHLLTNK